jgi:hypothetical protein
MSGKNDGMIDYSCEFCKKKFSKEIFLINHVCEKKRRWFQKDDPHVRFGFMAWNRFYELNSFGKSPEFRNSYHNFINSKYYTGFVKFGIHIRDINAIEPAKFIDYVIKNSIPLDRWTHDFVYEQYVRELTRQETSENALERNIMLMSEWSMQTGEKWSDFFRKVNTNQAVAWIKTGRISPWLLYNVDSAVDFFERCNPEQLAMIKTYAPPAPWKIKFNKNRESCDFIRNTLRESGM